ncbi:MAG: hypothetical protein MZW92_23905 [Comamonadaceae bacterium]|nr:hypothetical protein [Comamonadaceae bacterium]
MLKLDAPADSVVSAFFRQHRALGARERHDAGRDGLRRAAPAPAARSTWRKAAAARSSAGWRSSPGRAASSFLRGALGPHEQQLAGRGAAPIDRAALPDKLRHNLPDWLAGALREQLGDELLAAGRSAGRSRRRWTCASTR